MTTDEGLDVGPGRKERVRAEKDGIKGGEGARAREAGSTWRGESIADILPPIAAEKKRESWIRGSSTSRENSAENCSDARKRAGTAQRRHHEPGVAA